MLTQQEIATRLKNYHLFFGHMFFLPALGSQAPDHFFEELLEEEDIDPLLEKAGFEMKCVQEVRDGAMDKCDFPNWIIARDDDREPKNLEGWIVQVWAPSLSHDVRQEEDGSLRMGSYSPGMLSWEWFYSRDSIDDIVSQAIAWREEKLKQAWEKQQKKEEKPLDGAGSVG